jgi:magnesium-transporting ATPase (P-type)
VLAVASRPMGDDEDHLDADRVERDLELLGLIGLEDPPRDGVDEALAACRRAGIFVAMITGDHPVTARTIAEEVGLAVDGSPVVEGADLPEDDDELGALVDHDGIVLSRIDPEHKLRIARALQRRGHVVAMTGDGVNDGPALQQADIGIAMGSTGTDVAREASDLVLLEEDFGVIVGAVEQGRSTFANIRRFLTYHLTDNVAELAPFVVWGLSGGRFPLIIGVLQVLGLDIGTDTLPAVALGADHPAPDVLDRPPTAGHLLNRRVARRAFAVLGPTEVVMSFLAFGVTYLAAGWRWGDGTGDTALELSASGAAFAAIVVAQLTNAFLCRSSTLPVTAMRWTSNRYLLGAVAAEVVITGSFIFVPAIADAMDQAPPTVWGWLVVAASCPVMIVVDSAEKAMYHRGRVRRGRRAADAPVV